MKPSKSRGPGGDRGSVNRRGFFTEGLRHLLRPIGDLIEERLDDYNESTRGQPARKGDARPVGSAGSKTPAHSAPSYAATTQLRPPGALPEQDFLSTCVTSGDCMGACPVGAIKPSWSSDPQQRGKPVIEAQLQACVVCEDLACMKACPSGALQEVSVKEICMGTAILSEDVCVRGNGEDCQICVDKCPVGPTALEIPSFDGDVLVHEDACVGCGVCQMYCPTEPRALIVKPHASRTPRPG